MDATGLCFHARCASQNEVGVHSCGWVSLELSKGGPGKKKVWIEIKTRSKRTQLGQKPIEEKVPLAQLIRFDPVSVEQEKKEL
ncbi:hypothetical protein BaRGS_00011052 [Batillaria attramentaria]|uniref:Uncharacterized protein n=1 Tax=Batillaria attramentaria TaxID=370345 RepID=A0ABD0LDL2_9CAEN